MGTFSSTPRNETPFCLIFNIVNTRLSDFPREIWRIWFAIGCASLTKWASRFGRILFRQNGQVIWSSTTTRNLLSQSRVKSENRVGQMVAELNLGVAIYGAFGSCPGWDHWAFWSWANTLLLSQGLFHLCLEIGTDEFKTGEERRNPCDDLESHPRGEERGEWRCSYFHANCNAFVMWLVVM